MSVRRQHDTECKGAHSETHLIDMPMLHGVTYIGSLDEMLQDNLSLDLVTARGQSTRLAKHLGPSLIALFFKGLVNNIGGKYCIVDELSEAL
jgi:hypothetical protein